MREISSFSNRLFDWKIHTRASSEMAGSKEMEFGCMAVFMYVCFWIEKPFTGLRLGR